VLADFAWLEANLRLRCLRLQPGHENLDDAAAGFESYLLDHLHGGVSGLEPVRRFAADLGAEPDDLSRLAHCIAHIRCRAAPLGLGQYADRRTALSSLAQLLPTIADNHSGRGQAVQTLLRFLRSSPNVSIRITAVEALARDGRAHPELLEALRECLHSDPGDLMEALERSLQTIRASEPELARLIEDVQWETWTSRFLNDNLAARERIEAACRLAENREEAARAPMNQVLQTVNLPPELRQAVADLLERLDSDTNS